MKVFNGKSIFSTMSVLRNQRCGHGRARFRIISSLLLLSVMCFSLSSGFHWLWHDTPQSCRNTGHSCLNERLGIAGAAWQQLAHKPVNISEHTFDCPLCSGTWGAADCYDSNIFVPAGSREMRKNLPPQHFVSAFDVKLPASRAPPYFS